MMPDLRFAPLIHRPPPAEMISRMATDLVANSAFGSEAEAIRLLHGRYGYAEIIAFVDAAIAEAQRRAGKAAP